MALPVWRGYKTVSFVSNAFLQEYAPALMEPEGQRVFVGRTDIFGTGPL